MIRTLLVSLTLMVAVLFSEARAQTAPGPGGIQVPRIPDFTPPRTPDLGPRIVIPRSIGERLQELRDRRIVLPRIGSCTVHDGPGLTGASKTVSTIRQPLSQFQIDGPSYHLFSYVGDEWNDRISSYACAEACMLAAHDLYPASNRSELIFGQIRETLPARMDNAISSLLLLCATPG